MRGAWVSAVALAALGCAERATIDWGLGPDDRAFLIDGSAQPARIEGPFEASSTVLEAPEDPGALGLVIVSLAEVSARAASFDPSRELRLVPASAGCPDGRVSGGALELPLWPEARRRKVDLDTARLRPAGAEPPFDRSFAVRIPTGPESCRREGERHLVPFGLTRDPLLGRTVRGRLWSAQRIRAIARLDAERLVAVSDRALVLLRRGVVFEDEPGDALSPAELGFPSWTITSVFGLRMTAPARVDGYAILREPSDERSALVAIRTSSAGLEALETSTVVRGSLRSGTLDAEGRLIAVGDEGLFLVREPGATRHVRANAAVTNYRQVLSVEDPRAPHVLVGAAGRVELGRATAAALELTASFPSNGFGIDAADALASASGPDVLVASKSLLYRRGPAADGWRELPVALPEELSSCGHEDACGRVVPELQVNGLLLDRRSPVELRRVFFGLDRCPALAALEAGCATAILDDGGALEPSVMSAEAGFLTVVSASSEILELRLGEP